MIIIIPMEVVFILILNALEETTWLNSDAN